MLKKKMAICLVTLSIITASASPIAWAKDSSTNENLKIENATTGNIISRASESAHINANSVRFRRTPSFNGEVMYLLNNGTQITYLDTVIGDNALWAKISYNGITGYIYHEYFTYNQF